MFIAKENSPKNSHFVRCDKLHWITTLLQLTSLCTENSTHQLLLSVYGNILILIWIDYKYSSYDVDIYKDESTCVNQNNGIANSKTCFSH